MYNKINRRTAMAALLALGMVGGASAPSNAADITFTLATSGTETDMRSVAMAEVFAPMVSDFAITKLAITGPYSLRAPSWRR